MVLFFTSNAVSPPATIYMGRDKVENEDLIKYGLDTDVWFHVDKLSSAHVYLRLPPNLPYGGWDALPPKLVMDLAQLVKANSIEGNKKDNISVIYTPWANVKKTGDMAVGAVSFHSDKKVKRVHVPARDNAVVNRLNKTKVEKEVNHEQERVDRLRAEGRVKKQQANDRKIAENEQAKQWAEEKRLRSYEDLFNDENMAQGDSDDDFM